MIQAKDGRFFSEDEISSWRDVVGWDEYKISMSGDIYSKKRKKIMAVYPVNRKYPLVSLSQKGKEQTVTVHRLVALTYVPNPDGKKTVNHKDGDKNNYHFNNLEWCTQQENHIHAIKTGLGKSIAELNVKGEKHPASLLSDLDIKMIKILSENQFTRKQIAKVFNVHPTHVSSIILKKTRNDK